MKIKNKILTAIFSSATAVATIFPIVSCHTENNIKSNSNYCKLTFTADSPETTIIGSKSVQIKQNKPFGSIDSPIASHPDSSFLGWSPDGSIENILKPNDVITTNMNLISVFDNSKSDHPVVNFVANIEDVTWSGQQKIILDQPGTLWSEINKPQPTKENFYFDYWEKSGSKITEDFAITKDITISAVMTEKPLIITFSSGQTGAILEGVTEVNIKKNDPFSSINTPIATKAGYAFDGWMMGDVKITPNTTFQENTTLTPSFTTDVRNSEEFYYWDGNDYWIYDKTSLCSDVSSRTITATNSRTSEIKSWSSNIFNNNVNIGSKATTIPNYFLARCKQFNQSIFIPKNITTVGSYFMYYCTNFNNQLLLSSFTTAIADNFLAYCSSFNQAITIPDSCTSLGNYFLRNCTSFNQSLLGFKNITTIPGYFMYSCSNFNNSTINNLTNNNKVTTVGTWFMYNCTYFNQNLTIGNSVTSIGSEFMYKCTTFVGGLTISNKLQSIGNYFLDCCTAFRGLLSGTVYGLTLPTTLTTVGGGFMYGCNEFYWTDNYSHNDSRLYTQTLPASIFTSSTYSFKWSSAKSIGGGVGTSFRISGTYGSSIVQRFPRDPTTGDSVTRRLTND